MNMPGKGIRRSIDEPACKNRGFERNFTPLAPNARKIEGIRTGMSGSGTIPRAVSKTGVKTDEAALRQSFVIGRRQAAGRMIPIVGASLGAADRYGSLKVRWGIGRNSYRVRPGLYAIGTPGEGSIIFVTANYKLSFDSLRSHLAGIDAWILVLDTRGVNVWCAAGKGSFGTDELVSKLASTGMAELVSHRRIVLPQLGAPGVAARELARRSGFSVVYGPVRAADIPAWLNAGMKKDESMRTVRFDFRDRIALAPLELVHAWPFSLAAILLALAAALLSRSAEGKDVATVWPATALILGGGVLAGSVGMPALLPVLPFRAFSLKAAFLGALWGAASTFAVGGSPLRALSAALVCGSVSAFLGMNFTGCSTFTSQTGALVEVERGFIPILAGGFAGIALGGIALVAGL